jgi:hypothetical protein
MSDVGPNDANGTASAAVAGNLSAICVDGIKAHKRCARMRIR